MYGVPQKRRRVIITACRKPFIFPQPIAEECGLTIQSALEGIQEATPNSQEIQKICDRYLTLLRYVPPGGCWDDIPYDQLPKRFQKIRDDKNKYRSPRFFRRHAMSDISTTIKAKALPETSAIWHPMYDRSFSVREVARIQSFPDDFVFDGRSVCSNYRVVGNAVPPRLSYNLAQAAKEMLSGNNHTTNISMYQSEAILALGETVRYPNSVTSKCQNMVSNSLLQPIEGAMKPQCNECPLTSKDQQDAVIDAAIRAAYLDPHSPTSHRAIASMLPGWIKADHKRVGRRVQELVSTGALPQLSRRVGLDGKLRQGRQIPKADVPDDFQPQVSLHCGDAEQQLRKLGDDSVDCCVTSPPYFLQMDVCAEQQIGQ